MSEVAGPDRWGSRFGEELCPRRLDQVSKSDLKLTGLRGAWSREPDCRQEKTEKRAIQFS